VTEEKKAKVFFPNLDGWRFASFLAVFLVHVFHTDFDFQRETFAYNFFRHRLFKNGDLGVYFFFVLSGFLITYLLLSEQRLKGTIHIGSFYIRRALRIWPLYFFCLFFGFILFPWLKSSFGEVPAETANPVYYFTFLSNFDMIRNGVPDASVLSVLWSVAIEEQFYLVWPLLLFFTPKKYYPVVFLLIIGGSVVYRFFHRSYPTIEWNTFCVISDMAIGGLSAWLMLNSTAFVRWIKALPRKALYVLYLSAIVVFIFRDLIFAGTFMVTVERLIVAAIFGLIILEQNFCDHSFFKMKNFRLATFLGKYAYGLYCLHFIGILIQIKIGQLLGFTSQGWILFFGPLLAFVLSVGIALASYHIYEERFLKLKDKFAFITRGS